MQLARVRTADGVTAALIQSPSQVKVLGVALDEVLHHVTPGDYARELAAGADTLHVRADEYLPPIDRQEVWAAGVTYKRSKVAREEESAGAAQFYDKVYTASRPELFLKATPERVVGHWGEIRVRADATWSVPEPEFTLVVSPAGKIVGCTCGNDVSSRDIEGENPLYLPQAKVYKGSCAIGPCITLIEAMPELQSVGIALVIRRSGTIAFEGSTTLASLNRTPESLVEWLFRENEFPHGALLMTGTGIVPPDDFNLSIGDEVEVAIDGIGTLMNRVGE